MKLCKCFVLLAVFFWATITFAQESSINLASYKQGAKASSNGDEISANEKHPASGGIDGTQDLSHYSDGGVWLSSIKSTPQNPSIWQVKFSEPAKVNHVVIYHLPVGNHLLIEFKLEYRDLETENFVNVRPFGEEWKNPVTNNIEKVSKLSFEDVYTDSLRLVITKGSQDDLRYNGYSRAYMAEFEAYYIDLEKEAEIRKQRENKLLEIRELSANWRKDRALREEKRKKKQKEADTCINESPVFDWVRKNKIRTSHTGFGVQHLAELMPELSKIGFNAIDPAGRRFSSLAEDWEPAVKATNELAEKYDMQVTLWCPWYWLEDTQGFEGRNCLPDLQKWGEYRRAVDFRGAEMKWAPCPLSDAFWRDMQANVVQVAQWSKTYPRIWGTCLDFEFYGTASSRQPSDWYSYDFCFCDHCLGLFLQRIGSKAKACDIPLEERFDLLYKFNAIDAYYEMLTDEVRYKAEQVRIAAHSINSDFVLQFYGIPILPEPEAAKKLKKDFMFHGWFGFALAEGFGTKRLPCVYKPLDASDLRPGRWTLTTGMFPKGDGQWEFVDVGKSLQQQLDEMDLHVVHVPGFVICNESLSADMKRELTSVMKKTNGFWFNEGWMLLAMKDPNAPRPAWWSEGSESIENYRQILRDACSSK